MRNAAYKFFQALYWISLSITGSLGAVTKIDAAHLKGHADSLIPLLQLVQRFAWLSLLFAAILAVSSFFMKAIGPPWVREAIKQVLDDMHAHAFKNRNRAEFHDRITLFRYQKWCFRRHRPSKWPKGDHLVPFMRSGFMTQKASVVFRVPDDGDFEGVAGFAYSSNVSISREHLPDVSPDANPSHEDFQRYAQETFVNASWLKKERSTARSLYGIPVRVDGKPWGAIVIDSRQESIANSSQVVASYLLVASVLGQLIKRS